MKLVGKLFLSYLVVIVVGLAVIAISMSYTALASFEHEMMGNGFGGGRRHMQAMLDEQVEQSFEDAVNNSLLRSSVAAVIVAGIVSLFISQRITRPLRQLAHASQQLAAGQYPEPLQPKSRDEIGELTHHFNQMAHSLAEQEQLRQQLIADISHELKTPLATIKGYMEGLQDGIIPATDDTYLLIQQEADRLQRLVHDLQELSKAEARRIDLHETNVNVKELITSTVSWIRPQFEGKYLDLATRLPDDLITVRGDVDRLRQVLLNLLGNALNYTPYGGNVTVSLTADNGQVDIAVQDSGVGLSAQDLQRVFQRFYRVDKSRARASGGSGIGLTVSKHIVEAHGGSIRASSDGPGQGSTFTVTLPNFTETS
ncbi:MAG: ATP-binding protein [Chloroflexi bacterium]|nr:ATP-binding protein [Chloroflexota bacterium]